MSEDAALFDKGLPIRREVLGADYVDASMAKADDFMMAFQRATTAWAWGWTSRMATTARASRGSLIAAIRGDGPSPPVRCWRRRMMRQCYINTSIIAGVASPGVATSASI